jgi:hypothetical protein
VEACCEEEIAVLTTSFRQDRKKQNGDGTFEVSLPVTFLIGKDDLLRVYMEAGFKKRIEPETLLQWIKRSYR